MHSYEDSISSLQSNLSVLRKLYGWSLEDLGNRLGVTRQTVLNLERGNPKMTKIQYIAIRAILETEANEREEEEKNTLLKILDIVCNLDSDISEEQRNNVLEEARYAAFAKEGGSDSKTVINKLNTTLKTVGIALAVPIAVGLVGSIGSWVSTLLDENKTNKTNKKKPGKGV